MKTTMVIMKMDARPNILASIFPINDISVSTVWAITSLVTVKTFHLTTRLFWGEFEELIERAPKFSKKGYPKVT